GAGPRFFVPPISRKKKRPGLIDNLAADFVTLQMSILRNENGGVCRRPKSSKRNALIFFVIQCQSGSDHSTFVISTPVERFHPKRVRPMRFFQDRSANAIVPKQRGQSRERFIKLLRITQGIFKQSELLRRWPNWLRG